MRRVLVVGLALFAAACSTAPVTEIVLVVTSDYAPVNELARVTVTTADETGTPISMADLEVGRDVALPFSLGIRPAGDAARSLRLEVMGFSPRGGEPLVVRRVTVPFVPGERRRLVLSLARACEAIACASSEESCIGGACVDRTLPVSALDPVTPGQELDDLDAGPPVIGPDASVPGSVTSCRDDPRCDEPIDVEVGSGFACALRASGHVSCWGEEASRGQLGDGRNAPSRVPVEVIGIEHSEALAVGSDFACARSETQIACWGANDVGQLARADGASAIAAAIDGEAPPALLLAAGRTSCAGNGGALACWGAALPILDQPLPDLCGAVTCARTPVMQPSLAEVVGISDEGHLCVARRGHAACVGANTFGEVGDGTREPRNGLTDVVGLDFAWSVATTTRSTCALDAVWDSETETSTSRARCWGADDVGQLGDDGSATERCAGDLPCVLEPVVVSGIVEPVEVAATGETVCVRELGGRVLCWGSDTDGALGDGPGTPTMCAETPCARVPVPVLSDVIALDARGGTFCAVLRRGEVLCWGAGHGAAPTRVL